MNDTHQSRLRYLAAKRTALAAERTLMAWTRTSLSLITFGFTIYKFLQYVYIEQGVQPERLRGPRNLGLMLIGLGVIFLLLASLQFVHDMRQISPERHLSVWRLSLILAIFMVLVGALAFVRILFHMGPL